MSLHGYLALWCAVLGALALVGYGRSLAGMTRAQRAVRATGRIERVREPRHQSSPSDGISVVVSFQDPSTGQEFTVTNDGEAASGSQLPGQAGRSESATHPADPTPTGSPAPSMRAGTGWAGPTSRCS